MEGLNMSIWTLGLLIAVALAFDFMNGFHDGANSISTIVATGALTPKQAVLFAAFFNFAALWVFQLKVAATIGKGTVDPSFVDYYVIFGALVGALAWNIITWYYGIPSSSSHALVGGLVGATVAKAGSGAPIVWEGFGKILAFIIISPLVGVIIGGLLMVLVVDLPQQVAVSGRQVLQGRAIDRRRRVQPGPRRQRCAEDDRHHLAADDHCRRGDQGRGDAADLGDLLVLLRDRLGNLSRWLADRQDDGHQDHQAQCGQRFVCLDGWCDHARAGDAGRHSGVDDAYHHRRDHRCRGGHRRQGGALGDHHANLLVAWVLTIPAAGLIAAIFWYIGTKFL
jgi:hypothetical protein